MAILLSRKHTVFWVFVAAFFGLIFIMLNLRASQLVPMNTNSLATVCASDIATLYPTNSRFVVTKRSAVYDANPDPSCWIKDCKVRNNHAAYRTCPSDVASDWNVLGVISMERFLNGDLEMLPDYNKKSLMDAIWYFKNATKADISPCPIALLNLGISLVQNQQFDDAISSLEKALATFETGSSDYATAHLFLGLAKESKSGMDQARPHYEASRTSSDVERMFWGVGMTASTGAELTRQGTYEGPEALRSLATYAYFSPVAIGNYALLLPGTQDWFLENRYIVLRKILPPFILRTTAKYYRSLIDNRVLKLGDTQSRRYVAYNDRIARFIHNHITQMVRRITAHNAKPSYTYFGGYVAGASLKPHTDRSQCEFTISMNVEQYPHNRTWLLSLDKKPLFDKDVTKADRANNEMTKVNEDIADADLYAGDALLFMGRHLIHFRRGELPAGEWTNQLFMHFVQEGFTGGLN